MIMHHQRRAILRIALNFDAIVREIAAEAGVNIKYVNI